MNNRPEGFANAKRICEYEPSGRCFDERNNKMQEIQLTLTLAEVNQILAALGEKSYKEVFQLVSKIQGQASTQLNAAQAEADGSAQE
jgi:hypothetical protein